MQFRRRHVVQCCLDGGADCRLGRIVRTLHKWACAAACATAWAVVSCCFTALSRLTQWFFAATVWAAVSLWWLWVLPHAWMIDRCADALVRSTGVPRAVSSMVSATRFTVAVCAAICSLTAGWLSAAIYVSSRSVCVCVCEPSACQHECSAFLDQSVGNLLNSSLKTIVAFGGFVWTYPRTSATLWFFLWATGRR